MLPSHGAQNLSIPNHYFAFLRQVMEKMFLWFVVYAGGKRLELLGRGVPDLAFVEEIH